MKWVTLELWIENSTIYLKIVSLHPGQQLDINIVHARIVSGMQAHQTVNVARCCTWPLQTCWQRNRTRECSTYQRSPWNQMMKIHTNLLQMSFHGLMVNTLGGSFQLQSSYLYVTEVVGLLPCPAIQLWPPLLLCQWSCTSTVFAMAVLSKQHTLLQPWCL